MTDLQEQFKRRFLGSKIIVEEEREVVSEVDESGILVRSLPLLKAGALRLRKFFGDNEGDVPLYMEIEGDQILLGRFTLTFDTYTQLHTILRPYTPTFYWVTDGTQELFDSKTLISTAKLPKFNQQDFYIGV